MRIFASLLSGIPTPRLVHIMKYILASLAMYICISIVLFVAVDFYEFPRVASYVVIYFLSYIVDYIVNLRFIFSGIHSHGMVYRYTIHVGFFYLLNVGLFKVLTHMGVGYLLATWGIVALLFPARYMSYRLYVYRRIK